MLSTFNAPPGQVVSWIADRMGALNHAVEELEDDANGDRVDAGRPKITSRNAVVGITASGRTPFVLGAITEANDQGALTIGLTCNPGAELERTAGITIGPLVGPGVIVGSTCLRAGAAQKVILNMLSTGTMILLGTIFGDLTVDLQATNSKLRQRAAGIVQEAIGLAERDAAMLLQGAGGEAKTAIVASRHGSDYAVARAQMEVVGRTVRAALGGAAPCRE